MIFMPAGKLQRYRSVNNHLPFNELFFLDDLLYIHSVIVSYKPVRLFGLIYGEFGGGC